MTNNITEILKQLEITKPGRYENHFYKIDLDNSNEYAFYYSKLEEHAINTTYPYFTSNSSNNVTGATHYFEFIFNDILYNIFLIADFSEDKYYIKIKEN